MWSGKRESRSSKAVCLFKSAIFIACLNVSGMSYGQILGHEHTYHQDIKFPSIHIAVMASAVTGAMSGKSQFPVNRRTYLPESSVGFVAWGGEPLLSFYLTTGSKFGAFQFKGNYGYKDRVSYLWGYAGLGAMIGASDDFKISFDVTRCFSIKGWYNVYARTESGRKWFSATPLYFLKRQFWVFQPGVRFKAGTLLISIFEQFGQRSIVRIPNKVGASKIYLRGLGFNVWIPVYQIKL